MKNEYSMSGPCAYIPQGVDPTQEDIDWWNWYMMQPDDPGPTVTSSGSQGDAASAQNEVYTKDVGPSVGVYDPEWSAWLAGEIG